MENIKQQHKKPLTIAIVGAGFSGTAVAAMLHRYADCPLKVILFDKAGTFGAGDAYSTPYSFHILNVRAREMSAFEDEPGHFVQWLHQHPNYHEHLDAHIPIEEQFVPRYIYHYYLRDLLNNMQLHCEPTEVTSVVMSGQHAKLITSDAKEVLADKVIFALGNTPPVSLPFPVAQDVTTIINPWDYTALEKIPAQANVLLVGMGLSMIDAVLTLHHHHHQGKIFAVSRHGLLPQPHADVSVKYTVEQETLPHDLRGLTRHLRDKSKHYIDNGGDWRSVINALRVHLPLIWGKASISDRKRFIRHIMPYWNVHRHRVHNKLTTILAELTQTGQLTMLAGRVQSVEKGCARIRIRGANQVTNYPIDCVVNCMGPGLNGFAAQQPLVGALINHGIASLDPLEMGFATTPDGALMSASGAASSMFYALGPAARGMYWESTAVPEIRKQSYHLTKTILTQE